MTARFRYPLQYSKDVKSADALLSGANVEGNINFDDAAPAEQNAQAVAEPAQQPAFQTLSNGNVYIPIGQLSPGLYIVEAMLDEQRAVTMVFVGDTVAVTKTSSNGLFVWTVDRLSGAPVALSLIHI